MVHRPDQHEQFEACEEVVVRNANLEPKQLQYYAKDQGEELNEKNIMKEGKEAHPFLSVLP